MHAQSALKISVIIVTRDRASILPVCLDSILCQSHVPDEIILVAGNENSVPDQVRASAGSQSLVVVQCPEPNISMARNIGLEQATGDLVMFIDDDAQAHPGFIDAYLDSFQANPQAWAAGGIALDTRHAPAKTEFAYGLIRPSGTQIEVFEPLRSGTPRGYRTNVKGCNFALHLGRMPDTLRFDPFFSFAFDESDLIMSIHELGGSVVHVPLAVVDHSHAPGVYRADTPMDRDWRTEFASHTMFMLKHAHGRNRKWGWYVVLRRLCMHSIRAARELILGRLSPSRSWHCITQAIVGIRHAASSHDTARSSR